MTYVYAGAPNPRGMFNTPEIEAKADRLRDLFESKVPVTASGDGLSFTAHGKRPPTADAGEDEDHDT
jgi:hypothetical protein